MAEMTQDEVEAVSSAVPEFVESLTGIKVGFAALGIGIGCAIGGVLGYRFAMSKLETKYAQIAEEEIDAMRDHFRQRLVARDVKKPEISDIGKRVEELGYVPEPEEPQPGAPNTVQEPESEKKNIFEERAPDDIWDWDVEKESRDDLHPFVIHYDERGETGFEEVTLTYYSADDVLCDDKDKVIDDQEKVVGVVNLDKFGHGSNDRNIVYVRNVQLQLDIELVQSPNSYAEEVHGLKHSDEPRRRRIRREEE